MEVCNITFHEQLEEGDTSVLFAAAGAEKGKVRRMKVFEIASLFPSRCNENKAVL